MSITLKKFSFSYVYLIITVMLFSTNFSDTENALLTTILFLLLVNLSCFSNEYLLVKHYEKNPQKKSNIGYVILIAAQIVITLILFFVFKYYF
ncbi:hypothetical protein CHH53_10885 [Terribacillus sp. 7520-G]|nr:hypothetical protein CHH53_10885 [Terribacillus sp. 7520-G]